MQLDLLDLADGKTNLTGKVLLPKRTKELRLVLGENNTITVDDETFPLTVPSGRTSGLKLKGRKVFGKEGGFLSGLTLNLNLQKQLVVQAKKNKSKGKGKGKKTASVKYSYKLKPVIRVRSAAVEALPENMAAVVALPDEDVILNLDDESSLLIPAGAVVEPTVITSLPRNFFIELPDPVTGDLLEFPPLSPIYRLSPSGLTFAKPIDVQLYYDEAAMPKGFTEDDLIVY
ncbi:MAG: DUF4382 domain-containing protein, partial [Candidatus Electrothrix sp. AUS4]|nr:DUF4382 domain-containing protein [Candidatus Electrothrix sp. AUS4]